MNRLRFVLVGWLAMLLLLTAASCAPSKSSPAGGAQGTPDQPKLLSVTIQSYAFSPAQLTIKKGEAVTWTNQDNVQHTVTGDNGGPSSDPLSKGQSYSYTFTSAGTFPYHCGPHPYMKGSITVTD